MAILFFTEEIEFKLKNPTKTKSWIKKAAQKEGTQISEINYIFCSDSYLLGLNKQYLKHKTLTDIITFDNAPPAEKHKILAGDIFISIDRINENALKFKRPFEEELHRVMIHGVLHLIGYKDKNPSQIAEMRKKEEAYLSLRK